MTTPSCWSMDTGIRARELVGLSITDVHEDHLVVRGKGDKTREVGLGPTASKLDFIQIGMVQAA